MTKVLITGTFDIIHPGHLNLIKQARGLGNFVVAIIARDANVLKIKGREPHFNENQRLINLQKLNLVDKVILGDLIDPYKMILDEKPDIIALGYDQKVFVDDLQKKIDDTRYTIHVTRLMPFKEDFCKGKNIRQAAEDEGAGFLLINKPVDWTSHDVVAKLRSIIKIKQIGHTGTLDPFATGLLICAVGNATKMVGLFDLLPKTYEAEIKLGFISDTYDRTGKIEIKNSKFKIESKFPPLRWTSEIQNLLNSFIGKQQQLPPMYSAKKIGGKKLYDLARQGIQVEREPSEIEIYQIDLLDFAGDILKIAVKCSAGTYIRTLAYDLGLKLGTGALLNNLKRTSIGDFNFTLVHDLYELTLENYSQHLISPLKALDSINQSYLSMLK